LNASAVLIESAATELAARRALDQYWLRRDELLEDAAGCARPETGAAAPVVRTAQAGATSGANF